MAEVFAIVDLQHEARTPVDSTLNDVLWNPGKVESWRSGHARSIGHSIRLVCPKTAQPE
jgi:hypothetical protein